MGGKNFSEPNSISGEPLRPGNRTLQIGLDEHEYIFDQPQVQIVFIFLYSVVFCFCFFGNLAVVLVVTLHWRMRSVTKFCLGNLALANLCVGIFCVYQNLSTYLMDRWLFGWFMCKMYHFINSLSHNASILILVVVCVERYLAILYPFKCRQILTITRLKIIIGTVWASSALISSPRLYYITTYKIPTSHRPGQPTRYEEICAPQRNLYDTQTADMIYFIVLFLIPLAVISVLYTRMGIFLWHSAVIQQTRFPPSRYPESVTSSTMSSSSMDSTSCNKRRSSSRGNLYRRGRTIKRRKHSSWFTSPASRSLQTNPSVEELSIRLQRMETLTVKSFESVRFETERSVEQSSESLLLDNHPKCSFDAKLHRTIGHQSLGHAQSELNCSALRPKTSLSKMSSSTSETLYCEQMSTSFSCSKSGSRSNGAVTQLIISRRLQLLKPRQGVVRMLIVIVITFALCNFPFHVRKICQNYLASYDFGSSFSHLFTPLTFLLMYVNCAINPILYAFMSQSFRSSLKDLLNCKLRRSMHREGSQAL